MQIKHLFSFLSAAVLSVSAAAVPEFVSYADDDESNIIIDADFDDGEMEPWEAFGGGVLSIDDKVSYSGDYSLKITERNQTFQGPSIKTNYFIPEETYDFSAWVYHEADDARTLLLTLKSTDQFGTDGFNNIVAEDVPPNTWYELKGSIEIPADTSDFLFYIECSTDNSPFNIDSVKITGKRGDGVPQKTTENKDSYNFDFEEDTEGWSSRGSLRVLHTDEFSQSGTYSIFCSSRTDVWNGPSRNLNNIIKKGTSYFYSVYVMYNGEEYEDSHVFRLEVEYSQGGEQHYDTVCVKEVKKGKWTYLSGFHTVPADGENPSVYVQTDNLEEGVTADANDLMAFYIDNATVTRGAIVKSARQRKAIIKTVIIAVSAIVLAFIVYKFIKRTTRNNAAIKNASLDAMTKLLSRNSYEQRIAEFEKDPNLCSGHYFSMCDVNFMKYINDNFGHEKGDEAIITCAELLKRAVGKNGDIYRVGGDEFICIAKTPIAEAVKAAIEAEHAKERDFPFRVACGFAEYDEKDAPNIKAIIAKCDEEMFADKKRIKAEHSDFSRK